MVVVIGPDWLTVANERGRRLDDPDDHVRQEIEAALRSGLPLIPALVGGAPVPPVDALPQSLQPLLRVAVVMGRTRERSCWLAAIAWIPARSRRVGSTSRRCSGIAAQRCAWPRKRFLARWCQ